MNQKLVGISEKQKEIRSKMRKILVHSLGRRPLRMGTVKNLGLILGALPQCHTCRSHADGSILKLKREMEYSHYGDRYVYCHSESY